VPGHSLTYNNYGIGDILQSVLYFVILLTYLHFCPAQYVTTLLFASSFDSDTRAVVYYVLAMILR
jgi:hypothetical protein